MAGYCKNSGRDDKYCPAANNAMLCTHTTCPKDELPDGFVWVKGEKENGRLQSGKS